MTEQHPLTVQMCDEFKKKSSFFYYTGFSYENMCAAADWQLEQVIEQWEEVFNSNISDLQVCREFDKRLKAMRPQQQEGNS